TWNNIDFKKSVLKVDKQWKRLKSGMGLGTPKSNNSYREIPVPNKTLKKLEEYKKDNPTDINNRVILYKSASSLTWELPKKYRKAGYDITIHILRHTYATNLLANGLDFKTVARLMGHDVEQTFKTYSHVTDDMIQRAAQIVN
ncbi:site-specific integrase, partial [Stenotrophomonas maltophilia group sp. RNC7]|uniref:site-specific integrase n=1 Tax=Stenotrophomonas maltophilia group sp. RNC7 TaxID=3071467 RepID=UPI0027E1A8F5